MNVTCDQFMDQEKQHVLHYQATREVRTQIWKLNGLLVLNAILIGVLVGVGAYAPRYRRHPVIGVLFLGATTLFLPIISTVAASIDSLGYLTDFVEEAVDANTLGTETICDMELQIILIFTWAGLVVVIGINACVVVASDAREGTKLDPPVVLLVKAIWIAYLTFSTMQKQAFDESVIFVQIVVIMFTKLIFKYSTYYMAQRSYAFGRSPHLVVGYMAQLQQDQSQNTNPPALIVTGEDYLQVEKQPHGYNFKTGTNSISNGLVTLDRIWRLEGMDMRLQRSTSTQAKDLYFSFALFKLLRCRFAKYTVIEAGFIKASNFFRDTLLKGADYERLFGVIADELSFIHDYYYSSLPIYYSHNLLPILSITLSLYVIGYCSFLVVTFAPFILEISRAQIICDTICFPERHNDYSVLQVGNILFDEVPTFIVIAVLMLAEIRDNVVFICSNWTKVVLIYYYVNEASWQQSPTGQKCIAWVLKYCRCGLLNNWDDKMKQCSILVLRPWKTPLLRLRRLLRLGDQRIMVPSVVKAAIFEAVGGDGLTCEQEQSLKYIRPPSSPTSGAHTNNGGGTLSPSDGKPPAYAILAWHIATSIYEVRYPQPSDPDGHKIVATHLSRYCAYLVAYCPELLPGFDKWCKSLYDGVKKDADRVLSAAPGAEYQRLVELLSAENNHEVLKHGARLGKQLVDSKAGWEALARFWSEMILYVAPSENLEGHAEAIARGGELITLLWALLAHAGIVGRLDVAATSDAGRV